MAGLFSQEPSGFAWATGIEDTFIHQARPGLRALDEYELTQHYQLWREDLDLVYNSGIRVLRWGVPWHKVQPSPNQWDWGWTDQVLDTMVNVHGITPVLDLMHYGTPAWLDNSFINSAFPERVGEYAAAVAGRYKSLVRFFTPFNEPMVNVEWAGQRGDWPPYLQGDDGAVKLTLAIARGIIRIVQAIKAVHAEAVTVQVEALWRFTTSYPEIQNLIDLRNQRQYLSFDLTTGRVSDEHALCRYLHQYGMSDRDMAWLEDNAVTYNILGANFYPWSYGKVYVRSSGLMSRLTRNIHGKAIAEVIEDAFCRYQIPVVVTETSANRDVAGRARWMDETIAAVRSLREKGVPVVGYTWFPFFSMISWYYRRGRRRMEDYLLHLGLHEAHFDPQGVLSRSPTSLVERYQQHMANPMPPIHGMH